MAGAFPLLLCGQYKAGFRPAQPVAGTRPPAARRPPARRGPPATTGARGAAVQRYVIGYLAKISATRLNAFSAAACGVLPLWMMSIQPVIKVCSFWTWA